MIINKTLNKVISSSPTLQETLLDLTADTVAPGNLAKNETAHDKEGDRITGRFLTEDAEAWAVGRRNGVPVDEGDVTYHNNSKWYSEVSEAASVVSGSCMRIAGSYADAAEDSAIISGSAMRMAGEYKDDAHDSMIISGSFMHVAGEHAEEAEHWAEYARQYAEGGIHYKSSILFANIPTTGMIVGDMYDIKDGFITDSRFADGAGIECDAGTNIIWNTNGKWDIDPQGSGGGHTIVNSYGTEMTQRSKLQFEGAIVSDDETNNATVVETVNPVDYEEDIHGVNLIPYPYRDAPPKTSYGVTFTAGSNGAIVANGTNDGTGISEYHFIRILGSELKSLMKNQPCILSGCPSGGTLESYRLNFSRTDSWETVKTDTGEGVTILPSDIEDSVQYIICILITRNYTVPTNLTFKPMLRKATIQDDTYRPYNQQSIQHQLTEQTNVLGVKNLLKNDLVSQVKNGVTFTKNADNSITLSGTATDASGNIWVNIYYLELKKDVLYSLSLGIDESGKESKDACKLGIWNTTGGSAGSIFAISNVQNEVTFSIPDETVQYGIYVGCGSEFTGTKTVKPMLRLASDPDNTYVPYAMTNRELTEDVQGVQSTLRRTRKNITSSLSNLSTAVSEQDLGKYGYTIGDYFTGASGYTYTLADMNTFKGTATPYCITGNHLGIVVATHATSKWYTGSASSVGYNGSTLHSYLKGTVLTNIKSDLTALFGDWNSHLLAHSKLLTTATAGWAWQADQYISALTCIQVDGGSQWNANGYQEGEASKSLELFRKYKWTEIFGNESVWLRNISNYDTSAGCACDAARHGHLDVDYGDTPDRYVAGLIIFN